MSNDAKSNSRRKPRPVLKLDNAKARAYFLQPESYCTIDLPHYFRFEQLLKDVSTALASHRIHEVSEPKAREFEAVNHSLYNNKDGKYAWRALQIIHPAIYVSLVNEITSPDHWKSICKRFEEFQSNPKVKCLSIPLKSRSKESDKAEQVSSWWSKIEQKSIELSIQFDHVIHTDIVDCYGAIYTHSIAWALHTKAIAKLRSNRNSNALIGNMIDWHIQDMRYGQTNGIPQGSVLMDFIAEIVLGYADLELSQRIAKTSIRNYRVLRYRDDYRIFTKSSQEGEHILKLVTEILAELGMKLGATKTKASSNVIASAIKIDKTEWVSKKQTDKSFQKHLLIIHKHSLEHPNSGSLVVALGEFHRRVLRVGSIRDGLALIGIVADIAYHNPRTYPVFAAILSKLLQSVNDPASSMKVVRRIKRKFQKLPNTGHMQIWLQRITCPVNQGINYDEPLCKLVSGESCEIWENSWIKCKKLSKSIKPESIIDREALAKLMPVVTPGEISLFLEKQDYT